MATPEPIDIGLARLSQAVYTRPWARACEVFRKAGWSPVDHFDQAGSQAALVRRADAAALVFRGTEASRFHLGDLLANLGRPTRWAGPGWAHRGYVQHLERIRFPARRMAEQVSSDVPLYATGHSLGGALAALYAAWISADAQYGHALAALVTFGAPKSISRRGAGVVEAKVPVLRYVMPMDFAPYWPPSVSLVNPGDEIRLSAPTWWPGPVSRHDVGQYIAALEAAHAV